VARRVRVAEVDRVLHVGRGRRLLPDAGRGVDVAPRGQAPRGRAYGRPGCWRPRRRGLRLAHTARTATLRWGRGQLGVSRLRSRQGSWRRSRGAGGPRLASCLTSKRRSQRAGRLCEAVGRQLRVVRSAEGEAIGGRVLIADARALHHQTWLAGLGSGQRLGLRVAAEAGAEGSGCV
jgi:hypothetical protein